MRKPHGPGTCKVGSDALGIVRTLLSHNPELEHANARYLAPTYCKMLLGCHPLARWLAAVPECGIRLSCLWRLSPARHPNQCRHRASLRPNNADTRNRIRKLLIHKELLVCPVRLAAEHVIAALQQL